MKDPVFWGVSLGIAVAVAICRLTGFSIVDDVGGSIEIVCLLLGAFSAMALKRGMLGASSGFWHSVPGRWVIGRVAGAVVYTALAALLWNPAVYVVVYSAVAVFKLGGNQAVINLAPGFPLLLYGLVFGGAWRLRTPVKIMIGKGSRPFRPWLRSMFMGCGGSAAFASIFEEWANRWRPGLIFLGHSMHDRHWPLGIKDDRMMMTLAGNGGGKGETAIIPNLLTYRGSVFVNDTKGQNAAVTAKARHAMGQDVYVLSPFAQETAHLNPLAAVDPEAPDYVERIKGIVEALVIMGDDKNRVWSEWSKIVIEGLTDFAIRYDDGEFEPPEETGDAQ